MDARYATHKNPAWRDSANFIIHAVLDDEPPGTWFEQLWTARQDGGRLFKICCVPFFVYGVALGDVVDVAPKFGKQYVMNRVINFSGRSTFRVRYKPGTSDTDFAAISSDLLELGATLERSSSSLMAVDCGPAVASDVYQYLRHAAPRRLDFEIGKLATE